MPDVNAPMMVIRKKLTPDEVSSPRQRYNPDTNEIEYSPDGGTTWYPDETSDPRHSDVFRLPPLSGVDAKCDAAARIVHAWQDTLITFENSVNAAVFATHILGAFLILTPVIGILANLGLLVFDQLTSIGLANILAAFTSPVWDDIECIIYCHIGVDGQVSVAQRDAIMAEIATAHPGVVYNTLVNVVTLFGEVLMSNAGIAYDDTGDCDGCECEWVKIFEWEDDDQWFQAIVESYWLNTPQANWSLGTGWTQQFLNSANVGESAMACSINANVNAGNYRYIRFDIDVTFGTSVGTTSRARLLKDGVPLDTTNTNGAQSLLWEGDEDYLGVVIITLEGLLSYRNDSVPATGTGRIIRAEFRGVGVNPFG